MTYQYLPELNLYSDSDGLMYVLNEFDPNKPVYICVSNDIWLCQHNGRNHEIKWSEFTFTNSFKKIFKEILQNLLTQNAPSYLSVSHAALKAISNSGLISDIKDFSKISSDILFELWSDIASHYRSMFRGWYTFLAERELGGADFHIAQQMKTWKARKELLHLRDVVNWHETRGALIASEESVLRQAIENHSPVSDDNLWLHIYCWLLLDTVKRSSQILQMRKDALKSIEGEDGKKEYFVVIRPIKYQTGDDDKWWRIPETLAKAIKHYSSVKEVEKLQKRFDRLIVTSHKSLFDLGQIDSANSGIILKRYIKEQLKLISPRTNNLLHIRPTRIRHTGATRLAMKGVPRDLIQEILEHDSPESAKAYIDAVASELAPQIEKADRNMGGVFYHLNKAFFHGKISSETPKQPILIPTITETPLIVGSCGKNTIKDGKCDKHPFIGCYNGCSNFLAWREQDHRKALIYIEQEIERWKKASGHSDQKAILQEYQEVQEAILEVIDKIEADNINE